MILKNSHSSKTLRNYVDEFNSQIQSKPSYKYRKKVQTTSVTFFDYDDEEAPYFHNSPSDWCIINESQISCLIHPENSIGIVKFEAEEEKKYLENHDFKEECKKENASYLIKLAQVFLRFNKTLANNYPFLMRQRVNSKINELQEILSKNANILIEKPQMIIFLKNEINNAKHNRIILRSKNSTPLSKTELAYKIIKRKKEGILTVNQICKEFNISKSSYYIYCKKFEKNLWPVIGSRGRPLNEFSINHHEKEEIKKMSDDPSKSYTTTQIRAELISKFNRDISRNKIYRCLTQDLRYSFKRNTFAAPPAFDSVQKIIRYKVCKRLIEAYLNQKMIFYLDESGADIGLVPSASWAALGCKPYRKRSSRFQRLNLIMAITKEKIFAYKAVKGSINENHFIEFIQQICYKINNGNEKLIGSIVLYMDRHKMHSSHLTEMILKMTGYEILYSPVAFYQLNPIELLFGYIKRNLKQKVNSNM